LKGATFIFSHWATSLDTYSESSSSMIGLKLYW
jgi:hypothetical protein